MRKPTILLINRVYPPVQGATGRLLQDLAHALEQNGWVVSILTTSDGAHKPLQGNIKIHTVNAVKNYKTAFGVFWTWMRLLRKGLMMSKHDVVVTLTDPPMVVVAGRMICAVKKSAHVHWCQDLYPDLLPALGVRLPKFISNYLLRLSRRSMQKCSKVVVLGRCMAERLSHTGLHPAKIKMIANWADFEVIAPSASGDHTLLPIDPTGIAKKPSEMFRDDSPKFRVLYAGNIGRAHSVKSVVEAATLLRDNTEIEFVFVGDHHAHGAIARERTRRELENIKFIPYQPIEKLRNVMESGDVHLVSMRNQAKGLLVPCKFYSGLTVGRPTIFIGPEQTEIGHVIKEYNAGTIIPIDDGKALAEAIYHYRMDGEAWFQAQEGALRAAQAYHPNQSLHKWLETLEKARLS